MDTTTESPAARPAAGAAPEVRLRIRKTGPIWYTECPLTLTGDCNPKDGCEGFTTLPELHTWAMAHVAAHRSCFREELIRSGVKSLTQLRKQRQALADKGISVLDIPAAPLAADATYWEVQQEFRSAVGELAVFLVACGDYSDFAAAEAPALALIRGQYEALESLGLTEAA